MGLKIERWIAISFMIILYTDICIGQTTLLPEMVPFENEAWKLICKANTFTSTVSIGGPSGSTIGFCIPGAASCSANSGYALAINVTETTVTMTRTLTNNDNGTWTCSHTGGSANYVLQSPLLSRNFPQSKTNYFDYAMTASPGIEIDTTDPDYTFTFHYGCISTNLKFKWTTVPGVPWDDTLNTASTDLTCNTNQAFKSTQLTSVILPKVTQDGSKLKVSVYVDGYDNVQAVEEYTFNVTFSASSKSDATDDTHNTCLLVIQGVWSSVKGLLFCIIDKFAECVQFTYYVVQQWYFTCRYVFKGKVVYGLQLVIIAAITQLISMIPLILAFTVYVDNIRSYAYILIPVLFAVGPFIAVGIYLLYKRYCGQKEWLYTKFNTERATVKLSNEYGKKLNTVTKDKIYFKVKASNDLFITLLDDQQKPIVDIILGGYRQQSTHGVTQNDRVVYVKDVLVSTECRIFVLECGHSYITVTALSREIEKPLLKWELTNDDQGLEVCDIVISNFMQVGSYIRNENSTGYVQLEMTMQIENQSEIRNLEEQFGYPGEQSGNPGECTFLLRQGDCLLDNEDESCGLSCGICFVILFPIPWILCLLLRKLTDTNWIGLKLSSVLCCQNSVKPKAKEDILLNVPIVLTNISPKGGKNTLPAIGTTTTNENKPKKKKKKSRKQGESTRKTFPQDDTDNNEINTEADQYNK